MNLDSWQLVGAVLCLAFFVGLGIYSGKKIKSVEDFSVAGRSSGTLMVTGAFCGTLIGGSSTIGTAELAYTYGYSAWWFTLGAAAGTLILGLCYSKKLRSSNCTTIQDVIREEYGETVAVSASILTSLGMTVNIVSQTLAANLLVSTIFGFNIGLCTIVSASVMLCYVLFGGIKGAELLGTAKLVLLYLGTLACGILAMRFSGGVNNIVGAFPGGHGIFERGVVTDLCAGLSVLLGTFSTQTYIQTLLSAKSDKGSAWACVFSAALTPPVGFLCIQVGMYMRANFPDIAPGQALPLFIVTYLPGIFAGIVMIALLITVVGTASGMALGFSTVLSNDIYKRFINPNATSKQMILVSRTLIFAVIAGGASYAMLNTGTAVIHFGVISFGLRAAVAMLPLTAALFMKGKFNRKWVCASCYAGLLLLFAAEFTSFPVDSLVCGMVGSFIFMLIAFFVKRGETDD